MVKNFFRYVGDSAHIAALILLLQLIFVQKNAKGVVRDQQLFLLVFLTRYLDLFFSFYSLFNSCAKIFYVAATSALVYKIRNGAKGYDQARDVFPHIANLVLPCIVFAAVLHFLGSQSFYILVLLYTFSITLESVAIIPQLVLLQKYRDVQPTLAKVILFMGLYRLFNIVNWVYRARTESLYHYPWLMFICGAIQSLLYADFFYSYWVKCRATAMVPNTIEDGQEESQTNSNMMAYKSVLQNKVCCCDHIAKEEDEHSVDTTIDSNSETVRTPRQRVAPPPPFIFTWTVGLPLCLLCLCAAVPEMGEIIVIFILSIAAAASFWVGLWELLRVGLGWPMRLTSTNVPTSTQTVSDESDHKADIESTLEEPLLPDEESTALLEEGEVTP